MSDKLSKQEYNKLYYKATKTQETPEQKRKRLDDLKINYINKMKAKDPKWVPKNKKWNFKKEPTSSNEVVL